MIDIEVFLAFFLLSRKVDTLVLHARSTKGFFPLNSRYVSIGALPPTTRSTNNTFSLPAKCIDGVLREKNEDSRPFSKVDVYPYHLGELAFGS